MKTDTERVQENADLDDMVNAFAKAMRRKLQMCAESGYEGWNDIGQQANLKSRLLNSVGKLFPPGTPGTLSTSVNCAEYAAKVCVDIGDYAAMLHYQNTHAFAPVKEGE